MRYPIIQIGKSSDPELDGTSFVGVSRFGDSDRVSIVVPYGIKVDEEIDDSDESQKEQFAFLRRYVKVIQKAISSYKKESIEEKAGIHNPTAAINLLHDYLSLGRFVEYDSVSSLSERGKLDFNQTIKKVSPLCLNNSFFFDRYITRRKRVVDDNDIANIQCYIINHFMEHGGVFLFGQSISIPTRKVKLDRRAISKLKKELSNTFNSRKENIIRWCIAYIEGQLHLDENNTENGTWNYAMYASTFWEVLVDAVLGNQTERDKTKYGKTYEFTCFNGETHKGESTQHDTIYEDDTMVVIMDAKMYGNQKSLLSESVLGKQFGYYEQAKRVKKAANEKKCIINILVLPHYSSHPRYFQHKVILDPHTEPEDDPYKIIYLYEYPANELVDDFYYGRKKYDMLIEQFKDFIQKPETKAFLEQRGCNYSLVNS